MYAVLHRNCELLRAPQISPHPAPSPFLPPSLLFPSVRPPLPAPGTVLRGAASSHCVHRPLPYPRPPPSTPTPTASLVAQRPGEGNRAREHAMLLYPCARRSEPPFRSPFPGRSPEPRAERRTRGAVCQGAGRLRFGLRRESVNSSTVLPALWPRLVAEPLDPQCPGSGIRWRLLMPTSQGRL